MDGSLGARSRRRWDAGRGDYMNIFPFHIFLEINFYNAVMSPNQFTAP
jgi:hypothetical protein